MEKILTIILVTSAGTGWLLSYYFYRVHLGRTPEAVWWIPRILQMVNCRCDEIVDSDFGSTFGRPNAFWGLLYYPAIGLVVIMNSLFTKPDTGILFVVALLAFAYSIYLAWGLYLLKVACRPCFGAHIVNFVIFLILLFRAYPLMVSS